MSLIADIDKSFHIKKIPISENNPKAHCYLPTVKVSYSAQSRIDASTYEKMDAPCKESYEKMIRQALTNDVLSYFYGDVYEPVMELEAALKNYLYSQDVWIRNENFEAMFKRVYNALRCE